MSSSGLRGGRPDGEGRRVVRDSAEYAHYVCTVSGFKVLSTCVIGKRQPAGASSAVALLRGIVGEFAVGRCVCNGPMNETALAVERCAQSCAMGGDAQRPGS
jgi:hypothetical protein